LLPKQTHPGCSSRPFKSYLGAAPPLERGIKRANSLEAGSDGEHRNSPLERGASSTFFKGLEEAGCVARESLDKMLILVAFVTGKLFPLELLFLNFMGLNNSIDYDIFNRWE
jgi:hypothetical protein